MEEDNQQKPLKVFGRGISTLQKSLKQIPESPGIYQMINKDDEVIYVGKAKNLKKRVSSYTRTSGLSNRIQRMVREINDVKFIITRTEVEALLLEYNLIKKFWPRYNVMLKDNKTFPYIHFTKHDFPLVTKFRGARAPGQMYFGPFASVEAVDNIIDLLYKTFRLRSCSDNFFSKRTRPCLQYYIKKCSAPCVGKISQEDYAQSIKQAVDLLSGNGQRIRTFLEEEMLKASNAQLYEKAADYRDRIKHLNLIQEKQNIYIKELGDLDIINISRKAGHTAVVVFFYRNGTNYGSHISFIGNTEDISIEEALMNFIGLFYSINQAPQKIYIPYDIPEKDLLSESLSHRSGYTVTINIGKSKEIKQLLEDALVNAEASLVEKINKSMVQFEVLNRLKKAFKIPKIPDRIEIYDNSHISGRNAYGVMVVATPEGFQKKSYLRFKIEDPKISQDDYEMMREVMRRRFSKKDHIPNPQLMLIDGGLGQLSAVREALMEQDLWGKFKVVAIAKGEDRNAGREKFFTDTEEKLEFDIKDPLLHYLQTIRDEAHRFAISTHKRSRNRAMVKSVLDDIKGIGKVLSKQLLLHFGSVSKIAESSIDDLMKVKGISLGKAKIVYNFFHK